MSERINRRQEMIKAASELFLKHGYIATSVQQIADIVGCTKAALYYHFKEGKEEILQEVLHAHMPDMMGILQSCDNATSLRDLIERFGQGLMQQAENRVQSLRWTINEYPNFSAREQDLIHEKQLVFHQALADSIQRFVPDRAEAERISWQILCSFIGYAQYFVSLELRKVVDLPLQE
ncbi:MAG: TetR/AcrR family transcriptional regulator, partial [Anaerolineae bacterium]|nr:TetR/AcrR family transcriptional regulator [Anaerolineae bacterium]